MIKELLLIIFACGGDLSIFSKLQSPLLQILFVFTFPVLSDLVIIRVHKMFSLLTHPHRCGCFISNQELHFLLHRKIIHSHQISAIRHALLSRGRPSRFVAIFFEVLVTFPLELLPAFRTVANETNFGLRPFEDLANKGMFFVAVCSSDPSAIGFSRIYLRHTLS